MDVMIKVLNPQLAESLKNKGMNYTTETINGKVINIFFVPADIAEKIKQTYSKADFLFSNRLSF